MLRINKDKMARLVASGLSFVLVATGLAAGIVRFSKGKNTCKIPVRHTHTYISKDYYTARVESEKEEINGFVKQDDYKLVFDADKDFEDKLFQEGYLRIEDNLDLLLYAEQFLGGIIPSTDENGNTVNKVYGFYSYNIENENGELVVTKSPYVASLLDIKDDYPYIKREDFFTLITEDELYSDFPSFFDGFDDFSEEDEEPSDEELEDDEFEDTFGYDDNFNYFIDKAREPDNETVYKIARSKPKVKVYGIKKVL